MPSRCARGSASGGPPSGRGAHPGPICPDTLAKNIVKWNLRDLETVFNGAIRALAKAGVFGAKVTGIVDGTDLETTAHYAGCGQVTRKRRIEDKRGKVHEIEVTVYGWKVLLLIDAAHEDSLAVKVGRSRSMRRSGRGPWSRRRGPIWRAMPACTRWSLIRAFWMAPTLWWLDQQGILFVVPAKTNMAVTADARAQAAAGEDITVGRRVHTVRHGQGKTAWSERLETEVVGITGLTTYDQYGTAGAWAPRTTAATSKPNPINAVVVRKWQGQDYGPGGKTVFLTNASVEQALAALR